MFGSRCDTLFSVAVNVCVHVCMSVGLSVESMLLHRCHYSIIIKTYLTLTLSSPFMVVCVVRRDCLCIYFMATCTQISCLSIVWY